MRISDWSSDVCSSDLVLDASGKIERLVADAVLCTVPFSVIGDISFDPPLSEDKRQVIAQLHYAPATKVYLKMPRAYWAATGHSGFANRQEARRGGKECVSTCRSRGARDR